MKAFFTGLLFGVILLGGGLWYYSETHPHSRSVTDDVKNAARDTRDFVADKIQSLNISTDSIKEEMSRFGQVVRNKAKEAGKVIADETADARITATIKAKLLADQNLSSLKISVSTTDGRVTLSGTASSPENIRKAIQLAWDTDGVKEVDSTLQVKE